MLGLEGKDNGGSQTKQRSLFLSNRRLSSSVEISPLVVFSIFDHYIRRAEDQPRVIGTLLGYVHGGVIHVTNAFAVRHIEKNDEVAVGKDLNRQTCNLFLRVNRREQIVGWYATTSPEGADITDYSSLIHSYYTTECENPVHIVLDTSLKHREVVVKGYMSKPLQLEGMALANLFQQVPVDISVSSSQKIALNAMIRGQISEKWEKAEMLSTIQSDSRGLEEAIERLLASISDAYSYIESAIDGEIPGTKMEIGEKVADAIALIPRIRPELFDKMFSDNVQDLLMVLNLASMTKTQITASEKLNQLLG